MTDLQKAIVKIKVAIAEAEYDKDKASKRIMEWDDLLWDLEHDMKNAERNDYYHLIEDLLEESAK